MSVAVRAFTAVPAPTQAIAALSAACLVAASAMVPAAATTHSVPVLSPPGISLTAQPLPLPLDLLNQQVTFNVGLFVDWVTTGAALVQRQAQVPGSFVAAIGGGTPPLTAAAQALSTIADIEFEAGRDLIRFAQDIAVFQLQFRATTLSAFPPFNAGPGQQFVVATTTFGLNLTQQIADFALAVVTSVEQFTHNALGTPLPTTISAVKPTAAIDPPQTPVIPKTLVAPKTPTVQQDSTGSVFTPKLPELPKLPKQPTPTVSAPKFSGPKFSVPKLSLPKVQHPEPKGPSKG